MDKEELEYFQTLVKGARYELSRSMSQSASETRSELEKLEEKILDREKELN